MTITTITCTHGRPAAFSLSEKYLAAQTMQPLQMIVMDDGPEPVKCSLGQQHVYTPHTRGRGSMVNKLRVALSSGIIKGDALVIWEDDDHYAPAYLAWCAAKLAQFDLVGEGRALYYNVLKRWWFDHANMQHASLCSTSLTRAAFPALLKECENPEPFIDSRIWRSYRGKKCVFQPAPYLVVGMKGLPGIKGYGSGHNAHDPSERRDPDMTKLRSLMGEACENYAAFYQPEGGVGPVAVPGQSEFARVHGANWTKWLGHLRGKEGLRGCCVGSDELDSKAWVEANVFTHESCRYYATGSLPGPDFDPMDVVFVDNDHNAKGMMRNSVLAYDMLKPGGTMIFDDYFLSPGRDPLDKPATGINAFLACYAREVEVIFKGGQLVARKK